MIARSSQVLVAGFYSRHAVPKGQSLSRRLLQVPATGSWLLSVEQRHASCLCSTSVCSLPVRRPRMVYSHTGIAATGQARIALAGGPQGPHTRRRKLLLWAILPSALIRSDLRWKTPWLQPFSRSYVTRCSFNLCTCPRRRAACPLLSLWRIGAPEYPTADPP